MSLRVLSKKAQYGDLQDEMFASADDQAIRRSSWVTRARECLPCLHALRQLTFRVGTSTATVPYLRRGVVLHSTCEILRFGYMVAPSQAGNGRHQHNEGIWRHRWSEQQDPVRRRNKGGILSLCQWEAGDLANVPADVTAWGRMITHDGLVHAPWCVKTCTCSF